MSIVTVSEEFQPNKYLIVTLNTENGLGNSANVIVSDIRNNTINLVNIQKGPQGDQGITGLQGPPGKDGASFQLLPVISGGTNNTIFSSGYLISYDGNKLSSSNYTIEDIVNLASTNTNAITGIIAGSGLEKLQQSNNNVILNISAGDGLTFSNNQIIVDDSIVRKIDLSIGNIDGVVPISKGGTNNSSYISNRLIYYDGFRLQSFPLSTGQIVVSGSAITVQAGSGLLGGGDIGIPSGSVVIQVGGSSDILVEESSISLSPTGSPGTYTKVTTDSKGRVINGSNLTLSDIIGILGFTPWHPGNDGSGSGLDADLLDAQDGSFYRNLSNSTGILDSTKLSNLHTEEKTGFKFKINTKGLIEEVLLVDPNDIIDSLGYRPLNAENNDQMFGKLTLFSGLDVQGGRTSLYDNLPLFATNNRNILPSEPRGFTFQYGGSTANRTGILAYYPSDNQLRLITNVFGSSENTDIDPEDPGFEDDLNGGTADTIFITENIEGNRLTVLFREIADNLYINTNQFQQVVALKEFLKGINVLGQIRFLSDGAQPTTPPFNLGSNNLRVSNLNADLLDDQHGSYYRNAANMTGAFTYQNVIFDHIDGRTNYLAKFNDPNNPSRTIDSSVIKQRLDDTLEIETNLVIGSGNISSLHGLSVGMDNTVIGLNSVSLGEKNIASGNNSIALNYGSVTKAQNTVALNSYGLAYLENQTAFGAFATFDQSELLEHGQYSTIAAYLRGIETNGSWRSLSPIITLPRDKTVAFNIELLINKGVSSGVAHFMFNSGLINNVTYRNPSNLTQLINTTIIPSSGSKVEIFNNSQIRKHRHEWEYTDLLTNKKTLKTQFVTATDPPAINLTSDTRYLKNFYFYDPENVSITGIFEKSFDGSLILDVSNPRYYSSFSQYSFAPDFIINYHKPHRAVVNSLLDINYTSGSRYFAPSGRYRISSIIDDKTLSVSGPSWTATKYTLPSGSKLLVNNTNNFDKYFSFESSGNIVDTTISLPSLVNDYNYSLETFIKPDMTIKIIVNNNLVYNRSIVSINKLNNSITINSSIKNIVFPFSNINGVVKVVIDDLSSHLFKICDRLFVDVETVNISGFKTNIFSKFNNQVLASNVNDGGSGTVAFPFSGVLLQPQHSSFEYELDSYGLPSFSILSTARMERIPNGATIPIAPLFDDNFGLLNTYGKKNFDCSYSSTLSTFNTNVGVYVRYIKDKRQEIRVFDTSLKPIDFISAPVKFTLVDGPFSEKNYLFDIIQEGNRYYLYTKDRIFYNEQSIIPIRVRCTPSNTEYVDSLEKILYVYINELENTNPEINTLLEPLTIVPNRIFEYTLPEQLFLDLENNIVNIDITLKNTNSLPDWLIFDSNTLTLNGVPNACDIGFYELEIKAIDAGGLLASTMLLIEVSDHKYLSLEGFSDNITEQLKIRNVLLTNNRVNEKSKNALVGELIHEGGYNPYIVFDNGFNSASGTFISNSHMFRYAEPINRSFAGVTTISGAPGLFGVNSIVKARSSQNIDLNLPSNTRITNVFTPTVMSGTPIYSNKIFFDDVYTNWKNFAIFTGQNINENQLTDNFGIDLRAKFIDDYSITISNSLIQESRGLILTEDNYSLEHQNLLPKPVSTKYEAVAWSKRPLADDCYDCSDSSLSGLKTITYSRKNLDILLTTESNEFIVEDTGARLSGTIYDERIWYDDRPIKIKKAFRENINYNILDKYIQIKLEFLNTPSKYYTLSQESGYNILDEENNLLTIFNQNISISNIDYQRSILTGPNDIWVFDKPINNAVLYFQNLGNNNVAKLISEDRSYSGYFYNTKYYTLSQESSYNILDEENNLLTILDQADPLEYAILLTENNDSIIPENPRYNGSRVEISNRYEIIESTGVYEDNGQILSELLDNLSCENDDILVHDYSIFSQQGEAYLLFPGINNQIKLTYPSIVSYSRNFISEQLGETYPYNGYYEDNLSVRPQVLSFKENNFYYIWGKLIPYKFSTNEYAVRLNSKYTDSTKRGSLLYSGVAPIDGNYFPETTLYGSRLISSGYCPSMIQDVYPQGIQVYSNIEGLNYVTGLVTFYTSYAANNLLITSNSIDINKDIRVNDSVYIYNPASNNSNPLLPRVGSYDNILATTTRSISLRNFFLYPSTKNINHNGTISLNIDRNHEQIIKPSDIVNRIPIKFNSVFNNSNSIRIPKNNTFDILSISGQKIIVKDNKNYMLRPDKYLDGTITSHYTTNGISFKGSLFHDNETIYDIRLTDTGLIPIYKNITFEYNKLSQKLSINVPSGTIKIFDNIILSNFQPLAPYMVFDNTKTYNTGFKVLEKNISSVKVDDSIDRDYILLERSLTALQPVNYVKLTFDSNLFNNSISGTCILDNSLSNRIEKGYLLNYADNTFNPTGHQYLSVISGYSFSGFIPKYHNIISSNTILDDNRIGFSSIFNTGSASMISGIRSVRFAGANDIGHTEFYHIGALGFASNSSVPYSGMKGIGSSDRWYTTNTINVSGTSKKLEFLYLGHNSNSLRFFGSLHTSGSQNNNFQIHKISLSQYLQIERFRELGQTTGVDPILVTGTNNTTQNFNFTTNVNRFDYIIVDLLASNSGNIIDNTTRIQLNCYAEQAAHPAPLLVESSSIINTNSIYYPNYKTNTQNLFYILPSFNTTTKYCNLTKPYNKNNNIFYNGNIITLKNFSSINSYALFNDQLRIENINNNPVPAYYAKHIQKINNFQQPNAYGENLVITGITLDGDKYIPSSTYIYQYNSLRENTDRNVLTLGTGLNYLDNTGNITFMYHYSGTFDLLNYNNIHTQTYGDYVSRWPQDFDGKLINAPITGVYRVVPNPSICSSGKLCILIDNYLNNSLNSINVNQSYFFDFDDYAANLSNNYIVSDRIAANTISISVPYLEQYLGSSGLVFIIPSKYNIKSHLNPNFNNSFMSNTKNVSNLIQTQINYFDIDTKKWNTTYHIKNNLPNFSKYPIIIDNQTGILVYNSNKNININNISTINNTSNIIPLINNEIIAYKNYPITSAKIRLSTNNGSPLFTGNLLQDTPRIYISGLAAYNTSYNEPSSIYNYISNSGWNIPIQIFSINKEGSYPVAFIARDETGQSILHSNLIVKDTPFIYQSYPTGYAFINNNSWSLYFDIQGINRFNFLNNDVALTINNSPNDQSYQTFFPTENIIHILGNVSPPFATTGLWKPIIRIIDTNTNLVMAETIGTLLVLDNLNNRPDFITTINKFKSEYFINLNNLNDEGLFFSIPIFESTDSLNIFFNSFAKQVFSSFDASSSRYDITIKPTIAQTAYFRDANLSYNIAQNKYINGQPSPIQYLSDIYKTNITLYKPMIVNQEYNINTNTNIFDIEQAWNYRFALEEGALKHRPDKPPRVKLINTPSDGDNKNTNLSYRVNYKYDSVNQFWVVSIVGLPDQYGRFAANTGTYRIQFFADDYDTSLVSGFFDITYNFVKKINYIASNIYSTPNNEFFINADIADNTSSGRSLNSIIFNGENSINISSSNFKFNQNFNIWEYYATGNKLLDKWDARLVIDSNSVNPSITIQAKGIATDKITSVAKVNLLELQNNNLGDALERFPIKITGVAGGSEEPPPNPPWTPESGLVVEQGKKWILRFKTVFGLESPQHPPTIILSGMPSVCSGYFPDLDPLYNDAISPDSLFEKCLAAKPQFSLLDKSWNFSFSGDPSCTLIGEQDFSIIAIDTDLFNTPIYIEPNDIFESIFTYLPITGAHPNPFIKEIDDDDSINLDIEPFCNLYKNLYTFGPSARGACPSPTGLSGIFISGSLPSGLSALVTYNGPESNVFNAPLYNNLSNGQFSIIGQVLAYPTGTGNSYDEIFYLTVVDARGNSTTEEISFNLAVTPLQPNVYSTLYFDKPYPIFTPGTGTKPVIVEFAPVKQPAAFNLEIDCLSNLPTGLNKNCTKFPVAYSGSPDNPNRTVKLIPVDKYNQKFNTLLANTNIYFRPLDINIASSNSSAYRVGIATAQQISQGILPNYLKSQDKYIVLNNNISVGYTGLAEIVIEEQKSNFKLKNITSILGGDTTFSINNCLLGNGKIVSDIENIGIGGFIAPSFSGALSNNGIFSTNDIYGDNLVYSTLLSTNPYGELKYTACQETGYFRISGVVLPPLYVEITDPVIFSDNGKSIQFNISLSYGNSSADRSVTSNRRSGSAQYVLTNLLNNTIIQSGSVGVGNEISQPISVPGSLLGLGANNIGAAYKLSLNSKGGTFPTFSINTLPDAIPSNYYWVHRFGFDNVLPLRDHLPPICVGDPNIINLVSGELINFIDSNNFGISGLLVGGYVPIAVNGVKQENYSLDNGIEWSTNQYPPTVSGFILQNATTGNQINRIVSKNSNSLIIEHTNLSLNNGDKIVIDKFNTKITTLNYNLTSPQTLVVVDNISPTGFSAIAQGGIDPSAIFNDIDENNSVVIYKLIEDNIKTMPFYIRFINEGLWSFLISGGANILSGPYIYRILTKENSNMPIFRQSGWTPKLFYTDVPMMVNKPLHIQSSTIQWLQGAPMWLVTLHVSGGFRPALSENIILQISLDGQNWTYCGFNRYPQNTDKDIYNRINDTTTITLSSTSSINWLQYNSFYIKIFDSTGTDIIPINRAS